MLLLFPQKSLIFNFVEFICPNDPGTNIYPFVLLAILLATANWTRLDKYKRSSMSERDGKTLDDWQAVWQPHSKWLRTVLIARLRDEFVADEVLQEVALVAWRKRHQLSNPEKIEPWLYRIAIRQIHMLWRKQARLRTTSSIDSLTFETVDRQQRDPLAWLTSHEVHQQVRDAMAHLSNQDREILMLKHTEGWTYQQIAHRLGISIDKIIYRNTRACQRLRSLLQVVGHEWTNQ